MECTEYGGRVSGCDDVDKASMVNTTDSKRGGFILSDGTLFVYRGHMYIDRRTNPSISFMQCVFRIGKVCVQLLGLASEADIHQIFQVELGMQ